VPGQQIIFGADGQGICAARTNLAGVASCGGLLNGVLQSILGFGYQAAYLGNGVFGDSSANAPVISLGGVPILGL
jgi:hypothetical protein